jgi:hypothetical protein
MGSEIEAGLMFDERGLLVQGRFGQSGARSSKKTRLPFELA